MLYTSRLRQASEAVVPGDLQSRGVHINKHPRMGRRSTALSILFGAIRAGICSAEDEFGKQFLETKSIRLSGRSSRAYETEKREEVAVRSWCLAVAGAGCRDHIDCRHPLRPPCELTAISSCLEPSPCWRLTFQENTLSITLLCNQQSNLTI